MAIDVPNPIFRQEEWFRYIADAGDMPTGGARNRLEEWYVWLESMMMPKSGGTMTGDLDMNGNSITNLPETTADGDAVNYGQVREMIDAVAGIYRGAFASYAALIAVQWQTTDPTAANYVTNNDYAIVLDDETHQDEAWRYIYTVGVGWREQYRINESPLTEAQLAALNSGITATILTGILGNFAQAYDEHAAYDVGDYCVQSGSMYRCGTGIPEGGETWNADHWTAVTLVEVIEENALTAGNGIVIENKAISLIPKYNSYLVRATFEIPVLTLTMSGVGGAKEIGTPLTISTITHSETNADNITAGTLKFYRNGTAVQTITPSASSATVTLDEAITEAGTSAGSVSYKLQCTDTLGDTRSSSTITATWNRYVYSQVGDPATVPTSAENCVKQANLATFAANGADFTYAVGNCIWLLTTNANAKIQTNVLGQWVDVTYYSGGSVTFTQANGATATYYAYRTDAFIGAGTAKYRITNP